MLIFDGFFNHFKSKKSRSSPKATFAKTKDGKQLIKLKPIMSNEAILVVFC